MIAMAGRVGVPAHQGGWDEVLLVAAPVVLFVFLLRTASRRAAAQASAETSERPGREADDPATGTGPPTDGGHPEGHER